MRPILRCAAGLSGLLMTLLPFMHAHAGALDTCTQKDAQPHAVRSCVEGERNRAANLLREANQSTLSAVNQKVRSAGHRSDLRSFRLSQSHHVRARAAQCSKVAGELDRIGCEADADFAQIVRLQKMAE